MVSYLGIKKQSSSFWRLYRGWNIVFSSVNQVDVSIKQEFMSISISQTFEDAPVTQKREQHFLQILINIHED